MIAIEVAWTAPEESAGPVARKHSPVRRSVEDADSALSRITGLGSNDAHIIVDQ